MALQQAQFSGEYMRPVAAGPHAIERRWATRKPVATAGTILSHELSVPVPCVLRDISTTGARLELHVNEDNLLGPRIKLPSYFTLVMRVDRVEVDCAIVWRRSGELGVRFVATPRPSVRTGR
jgi:PilZ domain